MPVRLHGDYMDARYRVEAYLDRIRKNVSEMDARMYMDKAACMHFADKVKEGVLKAMDGDERSNRMLNMMEAGTGRVVRYSYRDSAWYMYDVGEELPSGERMLEIMARAKRYVRKHEDGTVTWYAVGHVSDIEEMGKVLQHISSGEDVTLVCVDEDKLPDRCDWPEAKEDVYEMFGKAAFALQ